MPDPNLQQAMAEIAAIFRKHDIGGAITLVSETHSMFRYHFSPSWSVIMLTDNGECRFRSKRQAFVTEQQQQRCIELSVDLLYQVEYMSNKAREDIVQILEMLAEHYHIEPPVLLNFELDRPQ